ncbi:MAG: hypothetical protein M1814_006014 [Vezdaea aestivalis]|nr:MAG: hypothetical protein M1814_006014 [Vezdaea aestivalis]
MRVVRSVFLKLRRSYSSTSAPALIKISNASFYREYSPSSTTTSKHQNGSNPTHFSNFSFDLPSTKKYPPRWAIIGPTSSGKTTLLQILQGQLLCQPPLARSYPFLSSDAFLKTRDKHARRPIGYVGFDGEQGNLDKGASRGAYLSARFESRTEATDFTLDAYLRGNTELNPLQSFKDGSSKVDQAWEEKIERIIKDLKLQNLLGMPVRNLSNGQTRRARIAKALLDSPELLLLDEPFVGLDPYSAASLSKLLGGLAVQSNPRIILALETRDSLPPWITHLVRLSGKGIGVAEQGTKEAVMENMQKDGLLPTFNSSRLKKNDFYQDKEQLFRSNRATMKFMRQRRKVTSPFVEMSGVKVSYGERAVLGNWKIESMRSGYGEGIWWKVKRMDRWAIFGPNGSGKTTLLSLLCSDHPQSYSLPIKIFGRSRLPEQGTPGISIFEIQSQIGQSSPEIHTFFPRHFSVRQTIESGWAESMFAKPRLTNRLDRLVDSALRVFYHELNPLGPPPPTLTQAGYRWPYALDASDWADQIKFGELSFGAQQVALFLRAFIKRPKILVLDEAFSGMDSTARDKCFTLLGKAGRGLSGWMEGDPLIQRLHRSQALVCVSHVREQLPPYIVQWMCLPEPGSNKPYRMGQRRRTKALRDDPDAWDEIWSGV